jgi:hypothetical protein
MLMALALKPLGFKRKKIKKKLPLLLHMKCYGIVVKTLVSLEGILGSNCN